MSFFKRLLGISDRNQGEVLTKVSDQTWVSTNGDVINQVSDDVSVSSKGTVYTRVSDNTVVGSDGRPMGYMACSARSMPPRASCENWLTSTVCVWACWVWRRSASVAVLVCRSEHALALVWARKTGLSTTSDCFLPWWT